MQVRVGSSLSDYYDQEQGVPQGGVLSTTLFSIKINEVGCAVISGNHSNFTAEAKAIDLALDFIRTCNTNNKFIIFSDSLSV